MPPETPVFENPPPMRYAVAGLGTVTEMTADQLRRFLGTWKDAIGGPFNLLAGEEIKIRRLT